ncbi:inositol 2-dehydrogenase [Pelomyxa schiedti]|nr:inositol 2-dehydrogenase [Pelomyxa schiedti]
MIDSELQSTCSNTGHHHHQIYGESPRDNDKLGRVCLVGAGRLGMNRLRLFSKLGVPCTAVVEPNKSSPLWSEPSIHKHPLGDRDAGVSEESAIGSSSASGDAIHLYEDFSQVPTSLYDGVWIASSTASHPSCIGAASEKTGNIFCEKPIAFDTSQVSSAYKMCDSKGVSLYCGWTRRFDPAFVQLFKNSGNKIKELELINKDYFTPTPEAVAFLKTLGSIFQDFVCHDLNAACLFMGELPLAVEATPIDSMGVGIWDKVSCVLSYSENRLVKIEADRFGPYQQSAKALLNDGTKLNSLNIPGHNVFERYDQAYSAEIEFFHKILKGEHPDNLCSSEHCLATAILIEMAEKSALLRKPLVIPPELRNSMLLQVTPVVKLPMAMMQIGFGEFGKYIQQTVMPYVSEHIRTLAIINTKNLDTIGSMLANPLLDSVYVCVPYRQAPPIVERCLQAKKKVLCEKPLLSLEHLCSVAEENNVLLALGFHRRFDENFLKAKASLNAYLEQVQVSGPFSLKIESKDSCPPREPPLSVSQYTDMLNLSLVHDLDMASWLFDTIPVTISVNRISKRNNGIDLQLLVDVHYKDRASLTIPVRIEYTRGNPTYVQQVHINLANGQSLLFGHNKSGPVMFDAYLPAYRSQFEWFACQPSTGTRCNSCKCGLKQHCETYSRTAKLLNQCTELILPTS